MTRINPRMPGKIPDDELTGMDEYDLAAVQGHGYDASNPHNWPDHLKQIARDSWSEGPEKFDAWLSSHPPSSAERSTAE